MTKTWVKAVMIWDLIITWVVRSLDDCWFSFSLYSSLFSSLFSLLIENLTSQITILRRDNVVNKTKSVNDAIIEEEAEWEKVEWEKASWTLFYLRFASYLLWWVVCATRFSLVNLTSRFMRRSERTQKKTTINKTSQRVKREKKNNNKQRTRSQRS